MSEPWEAYWARSFGYVVRRYCENARVPIVDVLVGAQFSYVFLFDDIEIAFASRDLMRLIGNKGRFYDFVVNNIERSLEKAGWNWPTILAENLAIAASHERADARLDYMGVPRVGRLVLDGGAK